ncbi:prolyl 3-hydroxylase OGFOD1 isoform X2 [Engraulis encrasicolus]|uniref:prolyl 3-hydroxylase OGFOD1 isoform X2 n=1 Tax=Engraulis encrasicolus TaxID=184585 RepID=UPI002FD5A3AA
MSCKRKRANGTSSKDVKKEKHLHVDINSSLFDITNKTRQQEAWQKCTSFRQGDVELDCTPFPHCVINQFLQPEEFLSSLEMELSQLNFHTKSNDLYKFAQSDDLKTGTEPCITELRSVLFGQFRCWLSELLDVMLEPTVDISCAKYQHTEHGQPGSIVKSLVPSRNRLVFFEVSPVSFHQVSEILSSDKCRMSVSGWFHGPSLPRPPKYVEAPVPLKKYSSSDDEILHKWISEEYMGDKNQIEIQTTFQESSEVCLKNFLKTERIQEIRNALQLAEIQWITKGPANKRHYEYAEMGSLPPCVQECWELLSSEAFFLLLSNLSGLKLHPLAENNDSSEDEEEDSSGADGSDHEVERRPERKSKDGTTAVCAGEVRRWKHGSYTLVHDCDQREFCLDLRLTIGCSGWKHEAGGFTSYIAYGEDEELLTVNPEDNSLALVYRDTDTLKFVKYVNDTSSSHQDPPGTFYDFSFVYYE